MDDPRCKKSRTDMEEPKREKLLNETVEPKFA
jgi:hypothetical protein